VCQACGFDLMSKPTGKVHKGVGNLHPRRPLLSAELFLLFGWRLLEHVSSVLLILGGVDRVDWPHFHSSAYNYRVGRSPHIRHWVMSPFAWSVVCICHLEVSYGLQGTALSWFTSYLKCHMMMTRQNWCWPALAAVLLHGASCAEPILSPWPSI